MIDHGRIVAEGTSAQLGAQVWLGDLARPASRWPAAVPGPGDPGRHPGGREVPALSADPLTLSVPLATPADPTDAGRLVGPAMTRLSDAQVAVAEVTLGQPSLHEAFLVLTGHPASPAATDHEDTNS